MYKSQAISRPAILASSRSFYWQTTTLWQRNWQASSYWALSVWRCISCLHAPFFQLTAFPVTLPFTSASSNSQFLLYNQLYNCFKIKSQWVSWKAMALGHEAARHTIVSYVYRQLGICLLKIWMKGRWWSKFYMLLQPTVFKQTSVWSNLIADAFEVASMHSDMAYLDRCLWLSVQHCMILVPHSLEITFDHS